MDLRKYISAQLQEKLVILLREKHLYQGVNLMDGCDGWVLPTHQVFEEARRHSLPCSGGTAAVVSDTSPEPLKQKYVLYAVHIGWHFHVGPTLQIELNQPCANLQPLDAHCSNCGSSRTFSPLEVISHDLPSQERKCHQSWIFTYACAMCSSPLEFYLFRDGCHLKLSGRFPIEICPVDSEIPKDIRAYVSEAAIAANTGSPLAGIFFLRVAIEQFFRSQPEVMKLCPGPKPTGDELGTAYNSLIPLSLKIGVPSLKELYSRLSDAIHAAKEDRSIFDSSHKDLVKHFRARSLFDVK